MGSRGSDWNNLSWIGFRWNSMGITGKGLARKVNDVNEKGRGMKWNEMKNENEWRMNWKGNEMEQNGMKWNEK